MSTPPYPAIKGSTMGTTRRNTSPGRVGSPHQRDQTGKVLARKSKHRRKSSVKARRSQPSEQLYPGPVTITTVFDRTSSLLYTSLTTGEYFKKCQLKYYRTSTAGYRELIYTVEVKDAIINTINA